MENWELIARKLAGELKEDEIPLFENWLQDCEANRKLFADAERTWDRSLVKNEIDPDVDSAYARLRSKLSVEKIPVYSTRIFRTAAVFLLVTAAAFFVLRSAGKENPPSLVNEKQKPLAPEVKKVKSLVMVTSDTAVSFYLSDSTHIILNKNSSLTYPETFSGDARKVTLTGEAFFEVKHDEKMPFIITAGNTETKVLGTSFNIKEDSRQKNVEVSVVTGNVQFTTGKENSEGVMLAPNEKVVYSQTDNSLVHQKNCKPDFWWVKNLHGIRKLFKDAKQKIRV